MRHARYAGSGRVVPTASVQETRVQRCAWFLTASGGVEHPAAIGAVVVATIPLGCQIMRLAQVDDGELVRLLVGSYRG